MADDSNDPLDKTDPELDPPKDLRSVRSSARPPKPPQQKLILAQGARAAGPPSLGILEPLMKDREITEIMVNDVRNIMIERAGKLTLTALRFNELHELQRLVRSIAEYTGRALNSEQPYLDTYLPDGSRVNIVVPPLTQRGPCITIRKFPEKRLTLDQLIAAAGLDARMGQFLSACVRGRLNVLISGGTGSGKTTLLNALVQLIARDERLVAIEDTPELMILHPNSVKMQTLPESVTSAGVPARELVANAMRMRPDRIVVGEVRRSEAFDMLQAMNTGHDGSMTTLHANAPRDALSRLETLCMLAGADLPLLAIRKQIVSALDLVIQIKRFRDGIRRITAITEITGMEGETVTLQELFSHDEASGAFKCTGYVPTFLARLKDNGVEIAPDFFN